MTKAISYSRSSVRAFQKFIAKQVEQNLLDWQDSKSITDQAATFFRHSDLRISSQPSEISRTSLSGTSPNASQAV